MMDFIRFFLLACVFMYAGAQIEHDRHPAVETVAKSHGVLTPVCK
jgi:hypothetical protein